MKKLSIVLILIALVGMLTTIYCVLNNYKFSGRTIGIISIILLILPAVIYRNQELGRQINERSKRICKLVFHFINLRRIVIPLIAIRVLWFLRNVYYDVSNWLYIVKNSIKIPFGEPYVLFAILFDIMILLILIFEILTLVKFKSKNNSFIRYGVFSCIGNFIIFIYYVCNRVIRMIDLMNSQGFGNWNFWRIFHFSIYDLMRLLVFLSALSQFIIMTKFKDKLTIRTNSIAEPLFINKDYEDIKVEEAINHED